MSELRNQLWAAYVRAVIGGELTQKQVAERVNAKYPGGDFTQATISRWLDPHYPSTPEPARVAAFASAFERPVLQAFLAAFLEHGMLAPEDVERGLNAEEVAFVLRLTGSNVKRRRRRAG